MQHHRDLGWRARWVWGSWGQNRGPQHRGAAQEDSWTSLACLDSNFTSLVSCVTLVGALNFFVPQFTHL